jgi:HlyD family secretion protein
MKHTKLIIAAVLVTTSIFAGCSSNISKVTGNNLINKTSKDLVVQGNIQTKEIDINSKIAGKIKAINVKEGDSVKGGQVLITIGDSTLLAQQAQSQAQIDSANAQAQAAQDAKDAAAAQLQKAQDGARPEEIAQAKAQYDLAQTTYNRIKALYDKNYVAKADLDSAQTQMEVAKEQYDLAQAGTRPEDIAAAQAQVSQATAAIQAAQGQVKQAQAGLQEVQTYINDTTIAAPVAGTITQLNVEAGELVSTGMPLLVITNTTAPWIECDVNETDLSKVKLNEMVSVKFPAYPNQQFKGKIVRINENPDFAVKRATNDNGSFDVLSYGVKVELTDINKPLYPGMTAMVDFGK